MNNLPSKLSMRAAMGVGISEESYGAIAQEIDNCTKTPQSMTAIMVAIRFLRQLPAHSMSKLVELDLRTVLHIAGIALPDFIDYRKEELEKIIAETYPAFTIESKPIRAGSRVITRYYVYGCGPLNEYYHSEDSAFIAAAVRSRGII